MALAEGLLTIGRGLNQAAEIPEMKERAKQRDQETALKKEKLAAAKTANQANKIDLCNKNIETMGKIYASWDSSARGDYLKGQAEQIGKCAEGLNIPPEHVTGLIKDPIKRAENRLQSTQANFEATALRLENIDPNASNEIRRLGESLKDVPADQLPDAIKIAKEDAGKQYSQAMAVTARKRDDTKAAKTAEDKELDALDKARDSALKGFNSNKRIIKANEALDASETMLGFLSSGNPISDKAIVNFAARASGEVGALTEADKEAFRGAGDVGSRLAQAKETALTGKLTQKNREFLEDFARVMKRKALGTKTLVARQTAQSSVGASRFLKGKEDEIFNILLPKAARGDEAKAQTSRGNSKTKKLQGEIAEISAALQQQGLTPEVKSGLEAERAKRIEQLQAQ